VGVPSTTGTARALLWETYPGQALPTRYVAYDAQPLVLQEGMPKTATFDMTADAMPADRVAGTVSLARTGAIQIDGYVRFDDGAPFHIVRMPISTLNFDMLMPKIPGSSVTVAALVGSPPDSYAIAHVDGLAPGQTMVQLAVPAPVSTVAPAGGIGNVGATATFEWSAGSEVALLTVRCKGPQPSDGYTTFNVVTRETRTQLPVLGGPSGIAWPIKRSCTWDVETHGPFATVDAATGPTGYFDPYSLYYDGALQGPRRDNGHFTLSDGRGFTTAP
jgi:hypothetical protein